jgi:anti-sigma factor RsiW
MPARQTCPPSVELDKLIVGQLSEPEVEELAAHIEQCPRCAETIRGLHLSDSLLEAAQGSRSAGGESGETAVEQLIQVLKGLRPAPAAPPAGEATQAGFVFPGAPARPAIASWSNWAPAAWAWSTRPRTPSSSGRSPSRS